MHRPEFRRRTAHALALAALVGALMAAACSGAEPANEAAADATFSTRSSGTQTTVPAPATGSTSPSTTGTAAGLTAPGTSTTEGTATVGDGRPLVTASEEPPSSAPETSGEVPATVPVPPPSVPSGPPAPEQLRVNILETFPHDPSAFTQGLVFHQGELYESTGLVGFSTLRRVALSSGTVLASVNVDPPIFAEGLALVGEELIQLSWRSGKALVYGRADLQLRRELDYREEGWGLCYDGVALVHSDGTATLRRRDPGTFAVLSEVSVTDQGRPVTRLNELECVGGSVYANVWQTDHIARIDPATGHVTAWIDAAALVPNSGGADDVLNGIAYDPGSDTFLLTGKRWSQLYRVTIGP
ncbi:MAG: glutaminyl-peptide cyclotransferase [Acidimicrobiales bacterium]